MTVDEVLDEVEKDASFYRTTGGGITLSGGECLLQPDFSAALLKGAHERGFNTAIETACNVPWAFVEKVLPHVDTMLHDHKLTIPERHKKWVGVGNERILANFKKAYETFPDIDFIARTPLIPGINADEEHIRAVLAFIRPHKNVIDYELLPYHRFGLGKYEQPGRGVRARRLQDAVRRPGEAPAGHHRRGLRPHGPRSSQRSDATMIKNLGHAGTHRRVAVNVGSGFVPGMNSVLMGAALAGGKLGWEMVGIRDGFEGLLHPDRYPDGGLVALSPELVENLDPATGGVLGQAPPVDPFHARTPGGDGRRPVRRGAEEAPGGARRRARLRRGRPGARRSSPSSTARASTRCASPGRSRTTSPRPPMSFGFNSALSTTIEMLNKAYQAARSARKIAVVEVPGQQAGWIALQAGIAARADAVLMPEIPCHLRHLAARLKDKLSARRPWGLVVVAEGAQLFDDPPEPADGHAGRRTRTARSSSRGRARPPRPWRARLRPRIEGEIYPLVIGPWARGGNPTAVDQQLGMAYGAGAVQVLKGGQQRGDGRVRAPDIRFVPLAEAVGKVRTVPHDSEFMRIAQSLGIYLGTGL